MKSMTGFSSVENSGVAGSFRVEMKSVNQKGLDVQMRLPRLCSAYEAALEKGIRARLARGKILVSGHLEVASGDTQNLVFDVAAARQVAAQLSEFAAETSGVDADLRSGDLAQMSVLWKAAAHEVDGDAVEGLVFATMDAAVEGLVQSRAEEGAGLKKLLFAHLDTINKLVSQIAGLQAAHPEMQLADYKKRLEVLLEDAPFKKSGCCKRRRTLPTGSMSQKKLIDCVCTSNTPKA